MNVGRNTCPRKAFKQDLELFLRQSMQYNFSIAVALDANENMISGQIARMFRYLCLIDTITLITSETPPGSHIRGSQQIDGVWVSDDIAVKAASFCPFNFGVGDHRIIIVDLEVLYQN